MQDEAAMLKDIRRRFVGNGEEHDLLSRLADDYQKAYDRGFKECEDRTREQAGMDRDSVRFAHELCSRSWEERNFLTKGNSYDIEEVAAWLKRLGRSSDDLRQLAEYMDRNPGQLTSNDGK